MLLIAIKYFVERKLAGRRAFNRTSRELQYSSDRDLADIGLSRSDVYPIAAQAALEAEAAVRAKAKAEQAKAKARKGLGSPPQAYY